MDAISLLKEVNSWEDFQNQISELEKKEMGDAFELLTKLYFKINPVYSFYDEVWHSKEVPQKVIDYLGLPVPEIGFDLIAKTGDEYHAIQCKYHSDKSRSVTFSEVSTFISLYERNDKLTQGYICSSSNVTSKNYQKLNTKPINLIMSDSWQSLDANFFNQARSLLAKKKYLPKSVTPKPHQNKALKQSVKYFVKEKHSRGKLIFPCGAGKSLTGYWMTEALKSKATLIAVPSLCLVKQTLDVYLKEIVAKGIDVKWLCICSDEGIGKNDDIVYKTENLGVPCQTNPQYIEQWLKKNKREYKIIFTTYQSGRIIAEVSKKLNFSFDVGIFDEAHKTVGSKKKLFSHLLFDENISITKRIFMTATERFYAGSKDDIISMDDYEVYGNTFAHMSFKEAIKSKLLTDYKVVTIDVKKSEISEFIKKNNLVQLNDKWRKETEARSLASMLVLRKAMNALPIKNAVSFHSSIDKAVRSKELQQHITDTYKYKPIDTYTVSGKMSTTKRNDIVQEFANSDKALITNARCLTEGVDVPNIDCIVFADPRRSKIDIVQALGRALRKKEGKDWGYVILPVVYDETTNEIDNDNFSEILAIVRGLAANDERIIEYFKTARDKGVGKERGLGSDVFRIDTELMEEVDFVNKLNIRLWEHLSRFVWRPFEKARNFVKGLDLKSTEEWRTYCISGNKPDDVPAAPHKTYKNDGWVSYGDWLGTGRVADQFKKFRAFSKAREFARKSGAKSQNEWKEYCKSGSKPVDIPSKPSDVYKKDGWMGYGDWLGTGRIADQFRKYRPFAKAREFARQLGFKSNKEWIKYCKSGDKPDNIPVNPNKTYRNNGWLHYRDWLGLGSSANRFMEFRKARAFARKLELSSATEWRTYCKSGSKPNDIPSAPNSAFKNKGWVSFGDWLGTKNIFGKFRKHKSFEDARVFARTLGLKSEIEWRKYRKSGIKDNIVPATPDRIYKNKGWKGYADFLGFESNYIRSLEYRNFNNARDFVRKLGLKSNKEWNAYCRSGNKPKDIPKYPNQAYEKKGWIHYRDWLGLGSSVNRFKGFERARAFARKLNLNSTNDWWSYCKSGKKPSNIPSAPNHAYKNKGWISFGDWLGTGRIADNLKEFKSLSEAKKFVRKRGLKGQKDWLEYCKSGEKPVDIPANPASVYRTEGWKSTGDWLGTDSVATRLREYLKFNEARKFVRALGLKGQKEWKEYCKSDDKPANIPANPNRTYQDKGWHNMGDWLGN